MANPRAGSIILLNGASSAGKSTLARAIQSAADRPFLRFSLDLFFFSEVLPPRKGDAFAWPLVRPRVLAGFYGCVRALADAGNDLVVDHIFEDQAGYEAFIAALQGLDLFLVGVHCPLDELERREQSRSDRGQGDARRDLETVHTFTTYDIEVDSSEAPEENATRIFSAWSSLRPPR